MSDTAAELYGFQSTLRRHPLDPLSPQEVKIATTAVLEHIRAKGGGRDADEVRFIEVALKEADKIRVILAKHDASEPFPQRHAMVIIWEKVGKLYQLGVGSSSRVHCGFVGGIAAFPGPFAEFEKLYAYFHENLW
jgi:Cu2+-containing amine oxidase